MGVDKRVRVRASQGMGTLDIGVVETRGRGTDESRDGHSEDEDKGRGSRGQAHCSSRREASLRRRHKRCALDIARGVRESERRRSSWSRAQNTLCVRSAGNRRALLERHPYDAVNGGGQRKEAAGTIVGHRTPSMRDASLASERH